MCGKVNIGDAVRFRSPDVDEAFIGRVVRIDPPDPEDLGRHNLFIVLDEDGLEWIAEPWDLFPV